MTVLIKTQLTKQKNQLHKKTKKKTNYTKRDTEKQDSFQIKTVVLSAPHKRPEAKTLDKRHKNKNGGRTNYKCSLRSQRQTFAADQFYASLRRD